MPAAPRNRRRQPPSCNFFRSEGPAGTQRNSGLPSCPSCPSWFSVSMSISNNIAGVRERIHAAARLAGRDLNDITLMAVTKTQPTERIREAYEAGERLFGENRVQEFSGKFEALRDLQGEIGRASCRRRV